MGAFLKIEKMNPFDALQDTSFDIITSTMGYDATWTPLGGGAAKTARVLFKDPTEPEQLAGVEYNPLGYMMEYRRGFLQGLFEAVRSGNLETVTVNSVQYYVRDVKACYDGRTYRAKLEAKP